MDKLRIYIEKQKTAVASRCLELGDIPPYEQGLIDALNEILDYLSE